MATVTTRFYYEDMQIADWLKLEAKGKLGPKQQTHLTKWRELKADNPDMHSMWNSGTSYGVWSRREIRSNHANES